MASSPSHGRRPDRGRSDRGGGEQARTDAAGHEIAGSSPVPMLLMPRLDTAGADARRRRRRRRLLAVVVAARRSRVLVKIVEARPGTDLLVHPEMFMLLQERRDVAQGIVEIAKMQRVGDAGIGAGRRRTRVDAGGQIVLQPEIDPVGAEGALLRNTEPRQILALGLVLHLPAFAIGEVGSLNLEPRLVGTGDVAIGAADADVVVDGDDAVRSLARRRRGADMHAGRVLAVLAADRHIGARHRWIRARLDVQHLAPLHGRRRRVGVLARRRAGLAADAALEVGEHRPAGHAAPLSLVTLTLTRSAAEPLASVRSSSIGTSAFMLGASKSLA